MADLQTIPGIGPRIEKMLQAIGVSQVSHLKGADPEALYKKSCLRAGEQIDRCLLYTYRCAVYFASHVKHDPEKLKWWNWKDLR